MTLSFVIFLFLFLLVSASFSGGCFVLPVSRFRGYVGWLLLFVLWLIVATGEVLFLFPDNLHKIRIHCGWFDVEFSGQSMECRFGEWPNWHSVPDKGKKMCNRCLAGIGLIQCSQLFTCCREFNPSLSLNSSCLICFWRKNSASLWFIDMSMAT